MNAHLTLVLDYFEELKCLFLCYQYEQMNSSTPTPKIIVLLPKLPVGCVKTPFPSNPIPYPEYLYLSTSVFLVILTASNKQFSKVKSGL